MKNLLLTLLAILTINIISAQERIDGTFDFQTDPAKKYSIYIPSSYDENTPNQLMLGLHPWNTSRWNSVSWCDTLITFAETNNLLLVCPDGGVDGQVDDAIDTAFTTFILEYMIDNYNIDEDQIYAMGFSWGARTTYTYGLNNVDRFAGFMPIGAAINGTDQVNGIIENANEKPFYLVHGSFDSPSVRYTPILNALVDNGACVESLLMSGIGHTIDFPNRNQILTDAFQWIVDVSCGANSTNEINLAEAINVFPNPVQKGNLIEVQTTLPIQSLRLWDTSGQLINEFSESDRISTNNLEAGIFLLEVITAKGTWTQRVVIQ